MLQPSLYTADDYPQARWARSVKPLVLRSSLALSANADFISFALGFPAVELFPSDQYAQATQQVLSTNPQALQYGAASTHRLKTLIVELMRQRGVDCRETQILLTAGAQQAMSLLAHLLLDPGGKILVEEITYSGIHQVITPFQPEVLTVPTSTVSGMDMDALEAVLACNTAPAFIYAMAEGHNPLGVSMSAAQRSRLVKLAQHYRVPLIEDDAYGFLSYDETPLPPLKALDDHWVYYIGSFSKILAPGLRVGWIVAPEELMFRLSAVKDALDLETTTFTQYSIAAYLDAGHLAPHLSAIRETYRARRDAMLQALRMHFPAEACWHKPASGLYVWVELPNGIDASELLKAAIETEHVAFIPGSSFCVPGSHCATSSLRLNFTNCSPARIEEGIMRLGRLVKGMMA